MSEWKETIIDYVCNDVITGGTPLSSVKEYFEKGEIPWLKTKEVNFNRIKSTENHISLKGLENSSAKLIPVNSVIVAMYGQGDTAGRVAINKIPLSTNQACCNLVIDEKKADYNFIYYFLSNSYEELVLRKTGSAQPNLNTSLLKNFPILLPPLPEQRAIAAVLSSLDDKIDLLHRQNKTLEAMAETLFRQWFVEEAGEDWELRKLGELVTVKRGGSPRPIQDFLSDSGLRWLKISDATNTASPFIFDIKECIKKEGLSKTTLLKKGSLVLSNSATPGIPKILQVDSCIHDGWLHFPESYFSNEFLYLLFKIIRPELLSQGNGSIFTNLKTDILKEYKILIPKEESLLIFQKTVKPFFEKLLSNSRQINILMLRSPTSPRLYFRYEPNTS